MVISSEVSVRTPKANNITIEIPNRETFRDYRKAYLMYELSRVGW
ncbi:hypothetical protein [Escherichia phage EC106]|uniref:Uncharacterized protein n=6 Tax=Felixounavirus TaxID=1198140 RepID=A0A9Y2E8Y2_9CAUD|nr:hypothetical protein garuso_20 [Escherichia phage garuso]QHR74416.1 hypothetical protein warpig_10 [Escherichia phage warpig]QPI14298.1 hypothetical protein GECvBBS_gp111c [Salmonella phage GEC_vB_BS]QPI15745.1 hypothetical protein GECvBNS7_gp112c [Salmonella phage GEC_vB_NS7]URO83515.1 hypothetical protein [Escherichia phage EC106]WIV79035.1 hypothetical protein [Salmonella phage NJ12]